MAAFSYIEEIKYRLQSLENILKTPDIQNIPELKEATLRIIKIENEELRKALHFAKN